MTEYDAIVIGSGAGGLSAALKITKNDHSVLVLEAMSEFGGCMRPYQTNGYSFDTGVHYLGQLGEGEPVREALDDLGLADKLEFVELDPHAIDRYVFPDFEFRLCKGLERFQAHLIELFPQQEQGIIKYFEEYDKIVRAFEAFMDVEPRPLTLLRWLLRNPIMFKYSRRPYQALLDSVTTDIRLQSALSACWYDYMLPPESASVIFGIGTWDHYINGGYYPRGGSTGLRDTFVKAVQESGAQLSASARVTSIDRRAGEFLVQTADGEGYTSKLVVSAVDPVITLGELVNRELVPSRVAKKAEGLRPSDSVFAVYIGTDLDLPSLGVSTGNVIHYAGYDINRIVRETMADESPQISNAFLVNSPSVRDPEGNLAPVGKHSLQILAGASYAAFEKWAHLPPDDRGEEHAAFEQGLGEQLISALEPHIPGLSQHLELVEYLSPLDLQEQVNLVRGGIYGPAQSPDQLGPGRFHDGTCGIEGLYLAGAGAIGGSVGLCVRSGVKAGTKAIDHLRS
jgi:phytoene dehydrogenase-like protein